MDIEHSITTDAGKVSTHFLHERIADHVRTLIRSGTLRPGDRVPSLRSIRRQFAVSMTTAKRAYETLEAAGWIEARPQSAFYVRRLAAEPLNLPHAGKPGEQPNRLRFSGLLATLAGQVDGGLETASSGVTLSLALPDPAFLPVKGLQRATQRALRADVSRATGYAFPPGVERLRRLIAARESAVGRHVHPEEVLITSGCAEALSIALQCIASPGDIIATESPTFFNVLTLIERLGMRVLELPTDPTTGLDLDALEERLRSGVAIRGLVTIASFSNPLGSCMPAEARARLAELAARHRMPVIEDDIYGDLHFDEQRPPLVRTFDQEGWVLTASSFSKTVAPGYRVGWLLAGPWLEEATSRKHAASMATATLPQLAVAEFLAQGAYERHLRSIRRQYRLRIEWMRQAIARYFPRGTRVTDPAGGFLLWIQLPAGVDGLRVYRRAVEEGIRVAPGHLFSTRDTYTEYLRLSCAVAWTSKLEHALERLGAIVAEQAGEGSAEISP